MPILIVIQLWPPDTRVPSRLMQHTTSITNISHWLSLQSASPICSIITSSSSPAERSNTKGRAWGLQRRGVPRLIFGFVFFSLHLCCCRQAMRNYWAYRTVLRTRGREGVRDGRKEERTCCPAVLVCSIILGL